MLRVRGEGDHQTPDLGNQILPHGGGVGGDIETSKVTAFCHQVVIRVVKKEEKKEEREGEKRGRRRRCKKGTGVDRSPSGQPPAEAGHVPLFIPLFTFS